jgi:sensor histidine kinase YesM
MPGECTFKKQSSYVITYDFIFSNRPTHRITRHVFFWISWWLYFVITFLLPTFHFPGYAFKTHSPFIEKFGVPFFIKELLIFRSLLPVILPQVAYTYAIIFFALPRYFFKIKSPGITTFAFIGMMVLIYAASIGLMYIPFYRNYILGMTPALPGFTDTMHFVNKSYLFHLPVVASFAVMVKLVKRWWQKEKETEQLANEKTKAELQLLKAQVHPHFLFNTLNNIYFFTLSMSPQAPEMIKKLTGMLHYILNECNQPSVALEKELKMIYDYIDLEKIRYGEQMEMTIETNGSFHNKMIAPLLLIPFVENSFKHGTSKMIRHPWIKLSINIEDNELYFLLINSKPVAGELTNQNGNIGLKNVRKRLQLLYPVAHELNIISEPESFTVFLKIKLSELTSSPGTNEEIKQPADYAMA